MTKEPSETTTERRLTRREVVAAGGAAAAALALGANPVRAAMRARRSKVNVTMFVFLGGALDVIPKAFVSWYQEKNPNVSIQIYENSNTVGYPLMVAAKKQGGPPLVNMGFFNGQTTAQGDLDGMWEKLDYSAMPNVKDIYPAFKRANQHGIGIGADQLGLVYNTQTLKGPAPTSWADLWNPTYAGQVTFFTNYWEAVYAAAKLNGGGLRNMTPGWNLWASKAHDQIRTIVTSNPQYLQVLTNGTASLTSYFNGTCIQWVRQGAPLKYVVPKEGAINVPVYLQSVAGNTPLQSEACQEIINAMLSPKWCGGWMNTAIEVPANQKVKLPAEFKSLPAFQPSTIEHLIKLDWGVVAKAIGTWNTLWNQDVAGKL